MNTNSAAPQQLTEDDLPALIAGLEKLVENGKRWPIFKAVWIDEQAFFIGTSKLKRALPGYLARTELAAPDRLGGVRTLDELGIDILRLIDELEQLAENGKYHVFDKVFIHEGEFYQLTAKLKEALPRDLKNTQSMMGQGYAAQQQPAAATSDAVLDAAQTEAQRIIAEARCEAERIVEEASQRGPVDVQPLPFAEADAPFSEANKPFGHLEQK